MLVRAMAGGQNRLPANTIRGWCGLRHRSQPNLSEAVPIIPTANTTFSPGLIAVAPSQELKQAGCSYRVGFAQSEFGLQVRCPAKNGIEVIFDYFGQRFIKLFCPLAKFPNGQRITIHLKARLVGLPIVESKAAHGPAIACRSFIACNHHMFSTVRASSDMRLGSHGGSHTMLTLASRTPGTPATAFSTWCGISSAEGQFGVVKVISMFTMRSSSMLTL